MKKNLLFICTIVFLCLLILCGCSSNKPTNTSIILNNVTDIEPEQKLFLNFKYGSYIIGQNENLLNEDNYIGDFEENIEFFHDNTFAAYIGWGNAISGTFEVSDDTITCIVNKFWGEYSPDQEVNAYINFKILDSGVIKISEASETYTIHIVDVVSRTLLDETKEMYLSPFMKDITFNFYE